MNLLFLGVTWIECLPGGRIPELEKPKLLPAVGAAQPLTLEHMMKIGTCTLLAAGLGTGALHAVGDGDLPAGARTRCSGAPLSN
jgi:hypothetical protein